MHLTGHPFVDVGFGIAANIVGKRSIDELENSDLCTAVKELVKRVININETEPKKRIKSELGNLKVLKDFWQNNPLMGINTQQLPKYEKILEELSSEITSKAIGYCQICGLKKEVNRVNRSWFPLGGSPDNDPTTLPELSTKWICFDCFRAVVILPLGCLYSSTGPYFYHVLDPLLQVEAVGEARNILKSLFVAFAQSGRIIGNQTLRKKTQLKGRLELLEIVSGNLLWDHTQPGSLHTLSALPPSGATMLAFSNDKAARLIQLHLPAQAVEFFSYLKERGKPVYNAFFNWAKHCQKDSGIFEKICDDIEQRRSLAYLVRTIVKNRKMNNLTLTKEERLVIQDYENVALQKKERFDMLERLAKRVNDMDETYRNRFVKLLGNTTTPKAFWDLLRQFAKSEKTGFSITSGELRAVATDSNQSEAISLLYLLCISEQRKEN